MQLKPWQEAKRKQQEFSFHVMAEYPQQLPKEIAIAETKHGAEFHVRRVMRLLRTRSPKLWIERRPIFHEYPPLAGN